MRNAVERARCYGGMRRSKRRTETGWPKRWGSHVSGDEKGRSVGKQTPVQNEFHKTSDLRRPRGHRRREENCVNRKMEFGDDGVVDRAGRKLLGDGARLEIRSGRLEDLATGYFAGLGGIRLRARLRLAAVLVMAGIADGGSFRLQRENGRGKRTMVGHREPRNDGEKHD